MTTYAGLLGLRDPALALLFTSGGPRYRDEFALSRPAPDMKKGAGVALSIRACASLVRALAAFDGFAGKLLLLSGDLAPGLVEALAAEAGCAAILTDRDDLPAARSIGSAIAADGEAASVETAWIMTTSGTTGTPKMVRHGLDSLARTVRPWRGGVTPPVWGLLYEPTRFAGMQVLLQATLGGASLAVPDMLDGIGSKIDMLAASGCNHLSGTPTFWRRILMHPSSSRLALRQITLGGEIADQAVLDALGAKFPGAQITHVYASTENGVGFSVKDGREGFPADYLESRLNGVDMKIVGGTLWLRPPGPRSEMLGHALLSRDADGFADTQDRVEIRQDRIFFLGRETGAVNVGGVKVYPETVERAINLLPEVAMSCVTSKRNPLSGAILLASVVPAAPVGDPAAFKMKIVQHCRARLPREAVPALIEVRDALDINPAGKLTRK